MIRVLHVLGALNPGGVATWLMHLLRHADREHVQMDFCTLGPEKGVLAAEAESLGSEVYSCPIRNRALVLGRRFCKVLRDGKYDVVHSHVLRFSGAILRWAHQERIPMRIAHMHTSEDGKRPTLARRAYRGAMSFLVGRHATHCLAASRSVARAQFGLEYQSDPRVQVLYNGIDIRSFFERVDARAIRNELGLPLDSPVIGHVGRFAQPKNHAFLVEIARKMISRHPEIRFLLIGDGPLRPRIEQVVEQAGLREHMIFAGTRNDVPRLLLGAMDLFLLPSLWEGLPIALLEAQAAGLPCLVSDRVTTEAVVLEDRIVRCALEGGAALWSGQCLSLLAQSGVHRRAGTEQFARSAFTIQNSLASLMDVYRIN